MRLEAPPDVAARRVELKGWLLDWIGKLEEKELAVAIMTIYQLWLARNEAREEVAVEDPDAIARRSLYLVEEWRNLKSVPPTRRLRSVEHWLPPEDGWCKANADGSFRMSSGAGGTGVVLRDHRGGFLAAECHFLPSVSDPERAELIACKRALELTKRQGWEKVCLETDCLGVITKLRSKEMDRSVHGPLVEEVKFLLKGFVEHLVRHARRSCNGVAHLLAKQGCENNLCNSWLVSPPDFVVELLASECAD
jgi:ribonuclease HI